MFTFTFEEYTRDNQNYLLVIDSKLEMAPQSVKIHFDNLFKDKILNEGFNRELSADWKKTFVHFGPIYFDSFAQAYDNVFNRFLKKYLLQISLMAYESQTINRIKTFKTRIKHGRH
jgi:hypothetical protein